MTDHYDFNVRLFSAGGINYYPLLDSTNAEARRLAGEGARDSIVVLADAQSAGRGRKGRPWHSPPGKGLYFSLLLRPAGISLAEAAPVTLAAAVAAARHLREYTGLQIVVKWPNDLLIGTRKVGGILTETGTGGGKLLYLVMGLGLNVNHGGADFPPELRGIATSLHLESGSLFDRTDLFLGLLEDLRRSLDLFFREGFAPFQAPWKEISTTLGRKVRLAGQGEAVEGLAVDLDAQGALLVEDSKGHRHRIICGEII